MKFTNKKAIIFDLDGTLINSEADLALAVNAMLTSLGRPSFKLHEIQPWIGNGAHALVKRALSGNMQIDASISESFFETAFTTFIDAYEQNVCVKTMVYPGVRVSLKVLKAQGFKLAIVTNKPIQFVRPILEKLGLDNLFEIILGGSCVEKPKPDPLPLETVCERLNISASECVMVGDSINDILPANAINMQSIALMYGNAQGEDLTAYNPSIALHDFSDIVGLFSPEANYAYSE